MNSSISNSELTVYRRFIIKLLATAFGLLLLIGIINLAIDPYDSVRLVDLPGINVVKPKRNSDGARISISADLLRGSFRTAFLGSSRTRSGMPDDVPDLPGVEINGGLAGANIFETVRAARLLAQTGQGDCVFIGLDFNSFSSVGKIKGSYWNSALAGGSPIMAHARTALSFGTLRRSWSTISANVKNKAAKKNTPDELAPGQQRGMFLAMLENFHGVYRAADYDPDRVAFLARAIDILTAQGVQVLAHISPIHGSQESAIWDAGQGPAYLQWRRDLVTALQPFQDRKARAPCVQGDGVMLWDFAGFQPVSTTPIPSADQTAYHPWHYETSHFTVQVGLAMVQKMTEMPIGVDLPAGQFGVRLLPEQLEHQLSQIEARRDAYQMQGPDKALIEELFMRLNLQPPPRGASRRFYLSARDFSDLGPRATRP